MTILCAGDTHVFLVGAAYCQCGGQINTPPAAVGWFGTGYAPPGYKPQPAKPAEDVPLAVFTAAQRCGASHLSADGARAYMVRMGRVCRADWLKEQRAFGRWWDENTYEMPADAVAIED